MQFTYALLFNLANFSFFLVVSGGGAGGGGAGSSASSSFYSGRIVTSPSGALPGALQISFEYPTNTIRTDDTHPYVAAWPLGYNNPIYLSVYNHYYFPNYERTDAYNTPILFSLYGNNVAFEGGKKTAIVMTPATGNDNLSPAPPIYVNGVGTFQIWAQTPSKYSYFAINWTYTVIPPLGS